MSNRLTKIYTRTGDAGDTGMADGSRVSKDDIHIHAQGDIDELNCVLGVLASHVSSDFVNIIRTLQNDLFNVGAEITLSQPIIKKHQVEWLENQLDKFNETLEPLKEFILPGGSEQAAICHLARAVCRRAERHLVTLNREKDVSSDLLAYMNRLSDLLFVLARAINHQQGVDEIYWQSEKFQD